ncbi:hypothetical protein [Acidocella facilis]|uniref:hypothetical protein n=1 Tax=Acidocella facilis TaxID=525 RepID=UPI0012DDC5D6|nr:hypothetical protein [Acidocella facilis]
MTRETLRNHGPYADQPKKEYLFSAAARREWPSIREIGPRLRPAPALALVSLEFSPRRPLARRGSGFRVLREPRHPLRLIWRPSTGPTLIFNQK